VDFKVVREDVPHHDQVALHVVDRQPVHAQVLGQQGFA
jgi:hypothetical protein